MARRSPLFRNQAFLSGGMYGKTRAVQNHAGVLKPLER